MLGDSLQNGSIDILKIPFQALEGELTKRATRARARSAAIQNPRRRNIEEIDKAVDRKAKKDVKKEEEWKRIFPSLKRINKLNSYISLDTRKSLIMDKGIKNNVNLINDVSGLSYDSNTLNILKKTKIPFVIHHTKGSPKKMQKNPKYKDVLIEIFDFFENKIKELRKFGILHKNIILDPGIGFGKNLKHNITLIRNISIFHSLGFPVMLGLSLIHI